MTYLPLTIQASSDGVANEPGIGGSGCGACAPIEFHLSFRGVFGVVGQTTGTVHSSKKSFTLRPLRVAMSVVYALLE